MKFLAIALLAVCLIQGHNAQPQFSGLRNLVSNAASTVSGAANNAVSAATNAAQTARETAANAAQTAANAAQSSLSGSSAISNALSTAQNAVSNARSAVADLSSNAQSVINSATGGNINLDNIKSSLSKLSPEELLETITGAETIVNNAVEKIQEGIQTTINNLGESAKTRLASTTDSWNSDVAKYVNKAGAAGIDVSACAVNSVVDLSADVVEDTTGCVTRKIGQAAKLLNNIIKLPKRAADVTTSGVAAYRKCSAKSGVSKALCHTTDTLPAAYKALVLVKDTVSYTTQSVNFVTTIQTDLATCAATESAKSALKAAKLAKDVVSCVKNEMTAAGAA